MPGEAVFDRVEERVTGVDAGARANVKTHLVHLRNAGTHMGRITGMPTETNDWNDLHSMTNRGFLSVLYIHLFILYFFLPPLSLL